MLKGISPMINPELLKILAEMGHGDEIVIGDGNFPAESMGKRCARCDGHGVNELLDAILQLFPLDTYLDKPVHLMEVPAGMCIETPIWDTYDEILSCHDSRGSSAIGSLERYAFYEEAKKAYAIIATGERAVYANLLLQKGVVE